MDKKERNEIKKFVLENDIHILQRKVSKSLFYDEEKNIDRYNKNCDIEKYFMENDYKTWHVAKNINSCYYKRVRRARERILKITENKSVFVTLTFTDDVLNKTSLQTRRKYVQRYLKSFGVPYVANIDFGGKNNREHYHAILGISKIDFSYWSDNYGRINAEVIKIRKGYDKALAKYISKLTNHCFKETTKNSYLIYSR